MHLRHSLDNAKETGPISDNVRDAPLALMLPAPPLQTFTCTDVTEHACYR